MCYWLQQATERALLPQTSDNRGLAYGVLYLVMLHMSDWRREIAARKLEK